MADFRKWLVAFAAVALLLSFGTSAYAQSGVVSCTTSTNTLFIDSEGQTELTQDFVLQCTNGTPTPGGGTVPSATFTFTVSGGTLTSRLESALTLSSEALLLAADPAPAAQLGCNTATTICSAANNTNGTGGGTATPNSDNVYNGLGTHYNMFQGAQSAIGITYTGVPFDPPGTSTTTFRVTNVRVAPSAANAAIVGTLTIGNISNPAVSVTFPSGNTETLAIAFPSLTVSSKAPALGNNNPLNPASTLNVLSLLQCSSNLTPATTFKSPFQSSFFAPISVTEAFAGAWKVRSAAQPTTGGAPVSSLTLPTVGAQPNQFTPGQAVGLGTESGFVPNNTTGLTTGTGGPAIGLADTGTQIMVSVAAVPNGVSIFVPNIVPLTNTAGTAILGWAVLTTYNGGFTTLPAIGASGSTTQLALTSGAGSAVYEILSTTNSQVETMAINVTPVYTSGSTAGVTTPSTGTATVTVNYAPAGQSTPAASTGPIPRYTQTGVANPAFTIGACTCNVLYPYVTDQGGFDTGIALANTTVDPFSTPAQSGTVTFNFYPTVASGATASMQTTSSSVAAGDQVTFTLFNGGDHGITPIKGFTGYIIAQANFQFCHGFAFLSDLGAKNLAMGFLGLIISDRGVGGTEALIH